MPQKVAVNPGQIVINNGSSFLVTDADGHIDENLAQGLFVKDTRLISYYEMTLNRHRIDLLASSNITHHSCLYVYTNPDLPTLRGKLPKNSLIINVRRDMLDGMHEDIDINNRHLEEVEFQLMLAIRSDFADIFHVKSHKLIPSGQIETIWKENALHVNYQDQSFHRGLIVKPDKASSPARYGNGRLIFDVKLQPGETWHVCLNFATAVGDKILEPKNSCEAEIVTESGKLRDDYLDKAMQLKSSNADIAGYYEQALTDLGALLIKVEHKGKDLWMPAAGIPWFMAVFGRDSIFTSLQTLPIYHEFASATVIQLAELQANEIDDWRDAQPGKILHELRHGELTQLHQLPYSPYYGTIDATPMWIVTLAETFKWNARTDMLDKCRIPLEKALAWIDKYGDFDNDGFVEYLSRSSHGTKNQGWKDSGEAIVYPDGKIVEPPIALCEVQGEIYQAWLGAANIYQVWGESQRAKELRQKAEELYQRFNERFWMEDEGFYCLGLDSQKQQIKSISSNPGQLLWTGIVPKERAAKVVQRLFQDDMWCGWGHPYPFIQTPSL